MTPYDAVLLFSRIGGLASRVEGIAAAALTAETFGCPVLVAWQHDQACPGQAEDAFDPASYFWQALSIREFKHAPGRFASPLVVTKFEDTVNAARWSAWNGLTPEQSRHKALTRFVPRLRPTAAVTAALAEFERALPPPADRIGVHVRRTDRQAWTHAARDAWLIGRLDGLADRYPNAVFVVAADNPGSAGMVTTRYGDRAIHTGARWIMFDSVLRKTSVEDAALDAFALSRCSRVIGTEGSSFSRLPGWLSGVPVEVS